MDASRFRGGFLDRSFRQARSSGCGLDARRSTLLRPKSPRRPVTRRLTTRRPSDVGTTIFGDYTITDKPKGTDADGNEFTPNAFNIGRAYINVTGNISHVISFRVTPDIARESGTGSSLSGSYTFRLKYAFAQFNLDQWMTRGTWARLGMQQTPWVDDEESIYRYRFQGTVFAEREGYLSSSDVGASFHYNLPGNYGDVHAGVYNGETYSKPEVNQEKGFMVRGAFRPLPL